MLLFPFVIESFIIEDLNDFSIFLSGSCQANNNNNYKFIAEQSTHNMIDINVDMKH